MASRQVFDFFTSIQCQIGTANLWEIYGQEIGTELFEIFQLNHDINTRKATRLWLHLTSDQRILMRDWFLALHASYGERDRTIPEINKLTTSAEQIMELEKEFSLEQCQKIWPESGLNYSDWNTGQPGHHMWQKFLNSNENLILLYQRLDPGNQSRLIQQLI